MTNGTSQGLFIVVAIVIFGIFVALSYTVFGSDGLSGGLSGIFEDASDIGYVFDNNGIPRRYRQAVDSDFTYLESIDAPNGVGYYRYTGSDSYVILPETINGEPLTSAFRMFMDTEVKGVAGKVDTLTDMQEMFLRSQSTRLEVDYLDTSNTTSMFRMFKQSQATSLDLSSFDTSNVTILRSLFNDARATEINIDGLDTSNVESIQGMFFRTRIETLDLTHFNTQNVWDMQSVFRHSSLKVVDLSSFDTTNVTNLNTTFDNSDIEIVYVRTQGDADRLSTSTGIPEGLTFIVK